jgi:uroporphyrin-III C-methyltransferase
VTEINTAPANDAFSNSSQIKVVGRNTVIWICLFTLFIAVVASIWFIRHQFELQQTALASMQDQILQQKEKLFLDQEILAKEVEQQLVSQQKMVQEGLDDLSTRVDSNATKLLALSSVNREDWKLAEIGYLLRMADYRVLIEKDNLNALALAQSADEVLRSLDQTGLQHIRKILAEEITVMKLAGRVDREGIYIRLSALANQIEAIPFVQPLGEVEQENRGEPETDKTVKQKVQDFFRGMLRKLQSYVRVRDHGRAINAILPPAEQIYLQQNLRQMLEQAQAAILRGENKVYKDVLVKAQNWINQYYELNAQSQMILNELRSLEQENIAPEYNNFENSRSALNDYINRQQQAAVRRGVR